MTPIIELSLFSSRLAALCEEMGASLQRAAFSPNIKDRLDFSCAVFDAHGHLCAQAAHIPVHLGSMAYAMVDLVAAFAWRHGDVLVVNDPYLGGTHLPDVTVVAPVFVDEALVGFVANRAHHANIGASSPGSMPVARSLEEEGVVIPPTLLWRDGQRDDIVWQALCGDQGDVRIRGDFQAQVSCCQLGVARLAELVRRTGIPEQRWKDFDSRVRRGLGLPPAPEPAATPAELQPNGRIERRRRRQPPGGAHAGEAFGAVQLDLTRVGERGFGGVDVCHDYSMIGTVPSRDIVSGVRLQPNAKASTPTARAARKAAAYFGSMSRASAKASASPRCTR